MKTKILSLLLFLVLTGLKAQIIPPFAIPDTIPNYDGSYDDFGQGHLFYPNGGEVRFANESQTDAYDAVQFYTMYTNPRVFLLTNNNLSFCHAKNDTSSGGPAVADSLQRIDIEWQGRNGGAYLARVDTQKFGKLNHITQWFGSSGRLDVAGGAAIACQSIYNNIDLVYTSNNAGLVMYFIVYPGGDYNDIVMHLAGSKTTSIAGNKLKIEANWEYTTFEKPQMYQYTLVGNVITPVNVCNATWVSSGPSDTYQISNSTPYNASLPLIIQIKQGNAFNSNTPGLCWSTYFGGYMQEYMTKTHCDASNNFYIAGSTNSSGINFPQGQGPAPILNGGTDAVVVKFDPAGKILWSVFMGGSLDEDIRDFDFYGNKIYCVGRTSSASNFPIKAKTGAFNDASFGGGGGLWDGFICEFTYNGSSNQFSFDWVTYFGGNNEDDLYGCEVDSSGNLYIVGASASSDMSLVTPSGAYAQSFNTAQLSASTPLSCDAIIGKFNTNGAQAWFSYFGTDALSTNAHTHAGDYFYGLTLSGNNLYACGKSGGTNLPSTLNSKLVPGNFDGILAHFTTSGVLNNTKYTDGNISNYAVKENAGDIYTVGEANSSMNAVNSGLFYYNGSASGNSDACFSVHNTNLSSTIHNSFLGGSADEGAYDIRFTTQGFFYIAGGTNSPDFPVTSLASMYTSNSQGAKDNFIACLNNGNPGLVWSSYLGGELDESLSIPPYLNSAFPLGNTSISLDNQNQLRMISYTRSKYTFPLDPGVSGTAYFQKNNSLGHGVEDATITCFDVADITGPVGLKEFRNTQFVFGLYPNPASKNLSITNTMLVNDNLRYAIYDASGKKLQSGILKSRDTKNVDVSMLPQGIYIINVSNGVKTYSNKFIKVED